MNTMLTAPTCATITPNSLALTDGHDLDDYLALGRDLVTVQRMAALYLADYAREGVRLFGREAAASAWKSVEQDTRTEGLAEQLELHIGAVTLTPQRRKWQLSAEHYLVAERECDDSKQMERWLEAAAAAKLNARQLKLSIRAGEVQTARSTPAGTRVRLPSLLRVLSEWRFFAEHATPPAKLTDAERAEAVELLRPIVEYARSLV